MGQGTELGSLVIVGAGSLFLGKTLHPQKDEGTRSWISVHLGPGLLVLG